MCEDYECEEFRERAASYRAIVVSKEARKIIVDKLGRETSLFEEVSQSEVGENAIVQAKNFLLHTYCAPQTNSLLEHTLNEYVSSQVSAEKCLRMLANTIELHLKLGIEPRTVMFMPVSFLGERQGVLCYVFGSVLNDDDRLALELLSDYVLLASRRPDYEIGSVLSRQAATIMRMQSSLMFLHESERQIGNACQSAMCLNQIVEELRTDGISESRHRQLLEQLSLESNDMYGELQRVRASLISFTDEILGRSQLLFQRLQIGEIIESSISHLKLIEGQNFVSRIAVNWTGSDSEVMAVPNLLSASMANFMRNGVEAARKKQLEPSKETADVEVCFHTNQGHVNIMIKDNGNGLPPEVFNDILEKMEVFESSHPHNDNGSGYALTTAHSIISSTHKGYIRGISALGVGIEWSIGIPVVAKEVQNAN